MCEEMEHTRARTIDGTCDAETNEHVAQLADGRKSQHALEVGLRQGNRGGKNGGDASNPGNNLESCRVSCCEEQEGARDHVDACRDHGSRVDERADGCGTFHSGWQPDM